MNYSFCVNDTTTMQGVTIYYLHSRLCLLTALIEYLTVLAIRVFGSFCKLGGREQQTFGRAWVLPGMLFGYTTV